MGGILNETSALPRQKSIHSAIRVVSG